MYEMDNLHFVLYIQNVYIWSDDVCKFYTLHSIQIVYIHFV